MLRIDNRFRSFTTGVALTIFVAAPVLADDSEIYQSDAAATSARPNVLFIMDTSGSMDSVVQLTPAPYNPKNTYANSGCIASHIYYSTSNNDAPDCSTSRHFPRSILKCKEALDATADGAPVGYWPGFGNPSAKAAQYRPDGKDKRWRSIDNDTDSIECAADEGVHGETDGSSKKWIGNQSEGGPWTSASQKRWSSISNTYRFYSANYLNYLAGPGATEMTRLAIVRDVAISLASSLQNVNLGLMRYSSDAAGGYVLAPVDNIATNRDSIIQTLKNFGDYDGNGGTPLSETLYEASLYLQGKTWDFGSKSSPSKGNVGAMVPVPKGQTPSLYKSPIEFSCQKNYIVYLTDGAPTVDDDANGKIETMINKTCAVGVDPAHDNGWTEKSGICMDELAAWMADTEKTDLSSTVAGKQNAQTYMIGFGNSLGDATKNYLNAIAAAGGTGTAYTAGDVPSLTLALQQIFAGLQEDSATFVTPSISVNAFNRAQTDTDLFFSLFKVNKTEHWSGNLKKYQLLKNKIVDKNDTDAVDASGFFTENSWSIWSPEKDGKDVTRGGAVSLLDPPATRSIFTTINGSKTLVDLTSANMTDALVGASADTSTCGDGCKRAVNWARGVDVNDADGDKAIDDQFRFMGDPMHGRPAVVSYGSTAATPPENDTVVFVPTNDGFLHAFTGPTKDGGKELWAFIPPELLNRLHDLSQKDPAAHTYGLDGDIRVLRLDKNQNGLVDGDDYVYLFFGMRSGGNHYYAMDVTDPTKPKLLWNIGPNDLPGVGQTWSPPVVTRVNVKSGNTDPEKFVLIFGGGYDTTQETQGYSTDTVGNRIYMVEAKTGTLLWSAGGAGSTPAPNLLFDQTGKEMNNSIPSRVTVIDTNGDQFADRMYVGDMGGRLWRFDIYNGKAADDGLVTGGIIAKLGVGGLNPAPANTQNRRFYNAPDVALIQFRGVDPFYNIAIGSGYRGHPLDTNTVERFYSIRDRSPYAMLTQKDYDDLVPVTDSDAGLVDITSNPTGAPVTAASKGWKLTMPVGSGEKILAESTTVNNTILFPSFEPGNVIKGGPCYPTMINRAYAVTAFAGRPALDFDDDGDVDKDDLSTKLDQQGIVGDINVALIRNSDEDPSPEDPNAPPTVCLAGTQVLKRCVDVGGTVRTFWNRTDAQ